MKKKAIIKHHIMILLHKNMHYPNSLSFSEGWGEAFYLPSFGGVGGGFL